MFVLSRPVSRAPQLTRLVDRLFADSFADTFDSSIDRYFGGAGASARTPALDVSETDSGYIVSFDLPGVGRDQLKVSVEGRKVSIETVDAPKAEAVVDAANTADAPKQPAPRSLYRERSSTRYARTVSLPAEVDQAASQAKFENGVLTLTLAKKVATGATQLQIS
jgi:HSP20 family protein